MRHHLNLDLAPHEKIVGLRRVTLRERIASLLLREPKKFTVIVPGDSFDQVTITQCADEDDDLMALGNAVGAARRGSVA